MDSKAVAMELTRIYCLKNGIDFSLDDSESITNAGKKFIDTYKKILKGYKPEIQKARVYSKDIINS